MPAGFHVASAYVDIHAEDAGLRGEIQRAIQAAVAGEDGKIKLNVDASGLRAKVEGAIRGAGAGARIKIQTDVDTAGLRAKVSSAVAAAGANQKVKVRVDVDTAGFRTRIAQAIKSGTTNQKVKLNVDVDTAGFRAKVAEAISAAGTNQRVKVGMDVDTAGLRAKVSAAVAAAGAGQRVRVGMDIDHSQVAAATGAIRTLGRERDRVLGGGGGGGGGDDDRLFRGRGGSGRNFLDARSGLGSLSIRGLMTLATLTAPVLGALLAPLQAIGLASASLVPAFLGLGMAAGAVVIGARGVGKAFSASGKDVEDYGKALNNLSPSAREFVRAGVGMKGALTDLRLNTQQALFQGLGQQLTNMGGKVLPALTGGFVGMAQIVNGALKDVFQTTGRLADQGLLQTMFGGLQTAFKPLATIPGDLLESLTKISIAASPLLTRMTQGISGAMKSFNDSIGRQFETGMLQAKIDRAGESIGKFFTNFKNNDAVEGFFAAMKQHGPAAAQNLQKIGEAGLTLVSSSAGIGSALLKVGGAAASLVNAIPTPVLTGMLAAMSGFSILNRIGPGVATAGNALTRLGQAIGIVGTAAAPAPGIFARMGTAATATGAAVRSFGTTAATAVRGGFSRMTTAATLAAAGVSAFGTRMTTAGGGVRGFTAAVGGTAAAGTRALGTRVQAVGQNMRTMAMSTAAAALSTKGLVAGFGILAAGMVGSGLLEWSAGLGKQAIPQTKALSASLVDMAAKGQINAKSLQGISAGWVNIGSALKTVLDPSTGQKIANILEMPDGKNSDLNRSRDMIKNYDQALADFVTSGNGDLAAKIFSGIQTSFAKPGMTKSEIAGQFKQYTEAVKNQAAAEKIAAMTMGTYGQEAVKTQKFINANKNEVQGLAQSYSALGRMNAGAIGAQVQYNQAASQAAAAVKDNGKALTMAGGVLNTTTPKAQAAAAGMLQMAEAAKVNSEAWVGKNDYAQAARGIDQARAAITKLGQAQGLTAAQAKEFTNQVLPNNTAKMWSKDIAQTAASFKTLTTAMAKAPVNQKMFQFDKSQIAAASTFRTAMEKVGATVKTMDNGNISIKVDTADAASKVQSLQKVFEGLSKGTKNIKLPAADVGKVGEALKAAGMDVQKISDTKIKITAEDGATTVIEGIKNKLNSLQDTPLIMGGKGDTKAGLDHANMKAQQLEDSFKKVDAASKPVPQNVDKTKNALGQAANSATQFGQNMESGTERALKNQTEFNALMDKYKTKFPNLREDLEKMRLGGSKGAVSPADKDNLEKVSKAMGEVKGAKDLQVQVQISGTEDIGKLEALNKVNAKNIQVAVNISGTEGINKLEALNKVANKNIQVNVSLTGLTGIEKLEALNKVADTNIQVSVSLTGLTGIEKLEALNKVNNKTISVNVSLTGLTGIEKLETLNKVNNKTISVNVSLTGLTGIEKLETLNKVQNKNIAVNVSLTGLTGIEKLEALNKVESKNIAVNVSLTGLTGIEKLEALNKVESKNIAVNVSLTGLTGIEKLEALNKVQSKSIAVNVSITGLTGIEKLEALNRVQSKSIAVNVSITGLTGIEKLEALNRVQSKSIVVNVSITGADQVAKLKALNDVQSKTIVVNVSVTGADQISKLKALNDVQSKSIVVNVSITGTEQIAKLKELNNVQSKSIVVNVSISGADDISKLKELNGVESKSISITATVTGAGEVSTLKGDIEGLANKSVDVKANVEGTGEVQALVAAIAAVQSKTVTVTVNTVKTGSAAGGGHMTTASLAPGFAAGGRSYIGGGGVHGIGTTTSDSIMARLSNGEFVIRASMVKKYGPEMLAAINHGVFNPNGINAHVGKAMQRWTLGFHSGGYASHHRDHDYHSGGWNGRGGSSSSSSKTYGVGGAKKDEAARGNWGDQFATGINYPKWVPPPTGTGSGSAFGISLSSLYRGAHNESVLVLQNALKKIYPEFDNSSGPGHFGPLTQKFYSMWQKSLGYRGQDANGIPGIKSLTALANRTGDFSVKNSQAVIKYIIQWGDTLSGIARKFGTSVDELVRLNNIRNPDRIYAGNTLKIPSYGNMKPPPAVIPGTLPGDWNYLAPPNFSKLGRRQDKTGSEDSEEGVKYEDVAEVEGAHQLAGMTTWDANHFFGNLTGTNQAALSNKIKEATDVKSLAGVLDEMRTTVMKAFSAGSGRDGLQSYLAQGGKIEIQYMKNLEDVNKQLEEAKSKNDELKNSYKQLNEQIQQNIQEFASLVKSGKAGASTTTMIRQMSRDAGRATEFQQGMASLRARGLNDVSLAQIANAGVVDGGRTVKSLLSATPQQIAQINALQAQVNDVANKAGTTAADSMYKAGMAASQGLVDGLTANKTQIENAMKLIAEAMQTAIKQALGIKSPSTVMHQNGIWTIQGLIQGLQAQGKTVPEIIKAIAAQIETNGKANLGGAISGTITGGTSTGTTAGNAGGGDIHINGGIHIHIDGSGVDFKNRDECREFAQRMGPFIMDAIRDENRKRS